MNWIGYAAMGVCGFIALCYAIIICTFLIKTGDMPHDGSAWVPWENKNGDVLYYGDGIDPNKDGERWTRKGFGFGGL